MSLATQAKVLRLLQEGAFERIGGNETIRAKGKASGKGMPLNCSVQTPDQLAADLDFRGSDRR